MIVEQNDYGMAEQGEYLATLASYEDLGKRPDPFNPGETKHQIKLVWKLADAGEQWDWVSVSLFPGSTEFEASKLYKIAALLLKTDPPKKLDLDTLIGKSCMVSIKRSTDQNGRDRAKIAGYSAEQTSMSHHHQLNPKPVITNSAVPF
jgi:hypothetical protein